MLFFADVFIEKNQSHEKQVNGAANGRMRAYRFPGCFHTGAPVDVVEDQDRRCMRFWQYLVKVSHRGLFLVIAVNKGQVNPGQ